MLTTLKELSKYLLELNKNECNTPVRLRSILNNVEAINTRSYVHSFTMIICNQLFKSNNIFGERICREFIKNELWKFNILNQNGMVSYPDLLSQTKKYLSDYVGKRLESYTENEEIIKMDEQSLHQIHFKAIVNKRKKQEDRYFGVTNVVNYTTRHQCHRKDGCICQCTDNSLLVVGLFDGHNGPEAAEHCHHLAPYFISNYLQNSLCSKGQYNVIETLGETFSALNDALNVCRNKQRWKAGTTCTMCLIDNNVIYSSWVGDCSAWLIYKDSAQIHLTNILHRPTEPSEVVDVWNNGGLVTMAAGQYDRVNGLLAVTRALGDDNKIVGVSPLPSVSQRQLDGTELCLVLASDGLWDCGNCSGADIGNVCRQFFADNVEAHLSIDSLCQIIIDRAVMDGASDNVSVVVVVLNKGGHGGGGGGEGGNNLQDSRTVRWPRNRARSCFAHEAPHLRQCPLALDRYVRSRFSHNDKMQSFLTDTIQNLDDSRPRHRRAKSLSQDFTKRFSSPIRLI